jgi:hypothetical protein
MKTHSIIVVALSAVALLAGCDDKAVPAAPSAEKSAAAAPVKPTAGGTDTAASPGDTTATKVDKPLAEWQSDDVKAALEKGGWKIGGSTQTKSAMLSIVTSATKGDVKATVNYYKNGGEFWKKRLEKDGAAMHEEGDVIVGVVIEGNKDSAQKLLHSLLGK